MLIVGDVSACVDRFNWSAAERAAGSVRDTRRSAPC
jgi:hypothetical protein